MLFRSMDTLISPLISLILSQDEVNSVGSPGQHYSRSEATVTGAQRFGVWSLLPPPGAGGGEER